MAHFRRYRGRTTATVEIPSDYPHPVAKASISKTFKTKGDARQWAEKVASEIKHRTWQDPRLEAALSPGRWEARPLRDTIQRYREEVLPRKDANDDTRAKEERLLQRLERTDLAAKPLREVSRADVAAYRDERQDAGRAPQTIRNELNAISGIFQYARHDWGLDVGNPVRDLTARKGSLPKARPARDRRLRPGEQERMEGAFDTAPDGTLMLCLWRVLLETGMRLSEALRLDVGAVRRAQREGIRGLLLVKTKNGDDRTVLLSKAAWQSLLDHVDGLDEDEPLIGLAVDAAEYRWGLVRKAAGSPDLRMHDLRHEALSRMAARKAGLEVLMAQSGHRDVKTLMRYLNPTLLERQRALFGDEDEDRRKDADAA